MSMSLRILALGKRQNLSYIIKVAKKKLRRELTPSNPWWRSCASSRERFLTRPQLMSPLGQMPMLTWRTSRWDWSKKTSTNTRLSKSYRCRETSWRIRTSTLMRSRQSPGRSNTRHRTSMRRSLIKTGCLIGWIMTWRRLSRSLTKRISA